MNTILTVDIRSSQTSDGWINYYVTNPLAENVHVLVALVWVVLAILATMTAYKITMAWQSGASDNIISDVKNWLLGMVLCIFLIFGLKEWVRLDPAPASGVNIKMNE